MPRFNFRRAVICVASETLVNLIIAEPQRVRLYLLVYVRWRGAGRSD